MALATQRKDELVLKAKELGIKGYSKMNKDELVRVIAGAVGGAGGAVEEPVVKKGKGKGKGNGKETKSAKPGATCSMKMYTSRYGLGDEVLVQIRKIRNGEYLAIQIKSVYDKIAGDYTYDPVLEIIGSPMLLNVNKLRSDGEKFCVCVTFDKHMGYDKFWEPVENLIKVPKTFKEMLLGLPVTEKAALVAMGIHDLSQDKDWINHQSAVERDEEMYEEGWRTFETLNLERIEETLNDFVQKEMSEYVLSNVEMLPMIKNDPHRCWRVKLVDGVDIDRFIDELSETYKVDGREEVFYDGCENYHVKKFEIEELGYEFD
jgi:hypothetical protein